MRISDWSSDVCSSDLFRHEENLPRIKARFNWSYDAGLSTVINAGGVGCSFFGGVMSDLVKVEIIDQIQIITVNRPEARNAVNYETAHELAKAFDALDANDQVRSEEHTSELQSLMRSS